jgi:hypothetical protein
MRYTPDFVTQIDGSECSSTNCWAAEGAMLTDASTGGAKTPTPSAFRWAARVPKCRPAGLGDIMRGMLNLRAWGRARYRSDLTGAQLRTLLARRTGYVVGLSTDFEGWPEESVCQADYNDREDAYHGIAVICGLGTGERRGEVRVGNPLCQGWRWVDVDVVVRAAAIYAREHGQRDSIDCIVVIPPRT